MAGAMRLRKGSGTPLEECDFYDSGIDRLIESQSRKMQEENARRREEEAWRESERKYYAERAAKRAAEWREHHERLAAVHESLAEQHRAALGELSAASMGLLKTQGVAKD